MNAAALPLRPSHPHDGGRGLLLALGAHGVLLWALAAGVNWHSQQDDRVAEAELWALVPQAAAPRAEEPPPPTEVAPANRPTPAPPQAQIDREADLAAERERERRKRELARQAEEEEARLRKERERRAQEQKAKQEADKKAADKKAAAERAERAAAEKAAKAEDARREAQRKENLRRIQGLAGGTGAPGSSGTAAQSAGPSAGYAGRIMARIKPNITFTEALSQRLVTEVRVRCAPDGLIIGRRVTKSSGNTAWDDAVLKAIDKTERIPRDTDGRVPAEFPIVFSSSD